MQEAGEAKNSFVLENLQRLKGPNRSKGDEPFTKNLRDVAATFAIGGVDTVSSTLYYGGESTR